MGDLSFQSQRMQNMDRFRLSYESLAHFQELYIHCIFTVIILSFCFIVPRSFELSPAQDFILNHNELQLHFNPLNVTALSTWWHKPLSRFLVCQNNMTFNSISLEMWLIQWFGYPEMSLYPSLILYSLKSSQKVLTSLKDFLREVE